ncbi:MAG: F0F1 ATP synthase subunit A [Microgenomates group bacterium]
MLHISLAAETIGHIGTFPITNSLALTWLVMAILIAISVSISRNTKLVPSNGQSIMEVLVEGLYTFFESVVGSHQVKQLFALIASLFLFILVSNWIGLVPGVGTIGFFHKENKTEAVVAENHVTEELSAPHSEELIVREETVGSTPEVVTETAEAAEAHEAEVEFVPLFRGPTADLNTTIALALVAFAAIQFFGFKTLGIHYGARFINVKNPIMAFVGILEIISDVSKVISFAFRLFGNVFAGEVLLSVMAFLMPFIAPMPFLALELFVGFIQALVFSTLTAVFVNVAVAHEG